VFQSLVPSNTQALLTRVINSTYKTKTCFDVYIVDETKVCHRTPHFTLCLPTFQPQETSIKLDMPYLSWCPEVATCDRGD